MSYIYVDRTGFEHPKYCMSCSKIDRNYWKQPEKGTTYCTAHQKTFLEEPFKTYYNMGQNNCPYCYPNSAD